MKLGFQQLQALYFCSSKNSCNEMKPKKLYSRLPLLLWVKPVSLCNYKAEWMLPVYADKFAYLDTP